MILKFREELEVGIRMRLEVRAVMMIHLIPTMMMAVRKVMAVGTNVIKVREGMKAGTMMMEAKQGITALAMMVKFREELEVGIRMRLKVREVIIHLMQTMMMEVRKVMTA